MNTKKFLKISSVVTAAMILFSTTSSLAAKVGEAAPAFNGPTAEGKTIDLADFKGKYVVLEWHNQDCPYVKAQYKSKNMQKFQKEWTGKGVTWITVNSSAQGKQGYFDAKGVLKNIKDTGAAPTFALLDTNGKIGRAYDAKTTPHMYVIDPQGKLIYEGAMDDHASNDATDVGGKINYVSAALTEAMAGKPVSMQTTRPYGCGVKY